MTSYPGPDSAIDAEARPVPPRLGRYELIGHLATGGMAEIHLARLAGEAGFEKIVVVKRLLPELVASQAFVAMFLDEGKLVARLDHPNVCEVHELGREGAEYFIAMPYLDGVSVHDLIARPREPDRLAELRIATGIVAQACAGLHHAHELRDADGAPAGLVHRDVSPSNLFVTASGTVKVLDFGIAKVRGAAETEAGTIKGKTQYMAPEQLLGEPLDRRCDVFALGIVLFELTTHQRLFKRASDFLAAKAILEEPIPRVDAVDPAVPPAVADMIARALARSPAERFADADALARALADAMRPHGGLATPAEIAAIVRTTDELTAQRTRQARVVGAARTRTAHAAAPAGATLPPEPSQVHTDVARTRALRTTRPPALGGETGTSAPSTTTPASAVHDAPFDAASADELSLEDLAPRRPWRLAIVLGLAVATASSVVAWALLRDPASHPGSPRDAGATAATAATRAPDDAATGAPSGADASVIAPSLVDGGASDIEMPVDNARTDNARIARKPGTISIDSTPFATIYVDGKRVDVTPILNRQMSAGRHRVRAVLADGRERTFSVDVPPGKAARPVTLTW